MIQALDSQVHLWLAYPDRLRERFAAYRQLLSEGERRRLDRFRVARGREEYLVGRALARTVLSRYAPIAPSDWQLVPDERGRPAIAGPAPAPALSFNLAHSHGLVACLVCREAQAGVDVEPLGREVEFELLAGRYFSPAERDRVLSRSGAARARAFFGYWTLKEAYLKALGVGIALPLRKLSFTVEEQGPISVAFAPPLDDDPSSWQFELRQAPSGHLLAAAVRRPSGGPLRLVAREAVPLSDLVRDAGLRPPAGLG